MYRGARRTLRALLPLPPVSPFGKPIPMTLPTLRPLGFGEVLDRAFSLYRRNFGLFVGTSVLGMVLFMAGIFLVGMAAAVIIPFVPGAVGIVLGLLAVVGVLALYMVPWGALAQQASASYTGKPASLGDGLRAGRQSALRLLGACIVAGVSFAVMGMLISLVAYMLTSIAAGIGSTSLSFVIGALTVLGTVAAFILVAAIYFAVVPAVVVEGKGPMEAITRSQELAEGALGRIAGTMLVSMLITYLPILAVAAATGGFAAMSNEAAANPTGMVLALALQQVLTLVISMLTMPFLLAVMVVLYYDRRVRTEALDVQILTEQLGLAGA